MGELKQLKLEFHNPGECSRTMAVFARTHQFELVDRMFIEDLEPLGQKDKLWAQVCEIAAQYVDLTDDPAMKCLGVAMMINATRRTIKPVASTELDQFFATAEMLRKDVSDESTNDRLNELLSYHGGIWFSRIGEYHRAADYQHRTALISEKRGKPNLAAISRLREMWEHLNEALVTTLGIQIAVEEVTKAAKVVTDVCTGNDPTDRAFRLFSAPVHVLLAHIWTKTPRYVASADSWFLRFAELDPDYYEPRKWLFEVIRAGLVALTSGHYDEAVEAASNLLMQDPKDAQTRMTANLVLAYAREDLCDFVAADVRLFELTKEGHEMHQLRALAQRLIDQR